jgi:hypothetical protein
VAGAPSSTAASASDNNVLTMTPPYGYTKLGGKNGIVILKKMYQLNKQIMALTDDLKLSTPKAPKSGSAKEGFQQRSQQGGTGGTPSSIETLSEQLRKDQETLSKTISKTNYLDTNLIQSDRLILHSRIKFGIGIVLGILMGYMAYRFFTSGSDLPKAIQAELGIPAAGAAAAAGLGMGMDKGTGDMGDMGDAGDMGDLGDAGDMGDAGDAGDMGNGSN